LTGRYAVGCVAARWVAGLDSAMWGVND
jgi:hypothetical protein